MEQVKVSAHHKNHSQLNKELEVAKRQVKIGGIYSHYKYPANTYRIIALGFREASDEICVIYQAVYDEQLIFIRELSSWQETPLLNGNLVPRFKLLESESVEENKPTSTS